ncbi:MAG TPA: aldose 1-epimerase [archaeon]|nr:aldose 1-epimerase [archaeon]
MEQALFSARVETDAESGQSVIVLQRGGDHPCEAKIAPHSGANLFSLVYDTQQLLYGPPSLDKLPGFRYGTPVLYPAPNRVAKGVFTFEGRTFDFGINDKDRFLHGLVHSVPWQYEIPEADQSGARVLTYLDFSPGSELYQKFGFNHRLSLAFALDKEGIHFEYKVQNRDSLTLPYGFALHPYFNFLGAREEAYLCVPAKAHMEAVDLMPTGRLEELEGSPYDLRQPTQVAGLVLDEVYYGMTPEKSAFIEYRQAGIKVELAASPEFTHMVVYAQPQNPFFCVENQTCSTDAHNLYARGLVEETHLLFAPPGGVGTGWIRYKISPLE